MTDKVDISKIRVGDEVTIRAVVTELGATGHEVRVLPEDFAKESGSQWTLAIVSHTPKPRPLEVGDIIRRPNTQGFATVVGVHEGLAWVKWCNFDTYTFPVSVLERVS